MARTKEEREQRRLEAKKRLEARKATKLQAKQGGAGGCGNDASSAPSASSASNAKVDLRSSLPASTEHNASLPMLRLPNDALGRVARFLPARELGAVGLTCSGLNSAVGASRVYHLCSRIMRRQDADGKTSPCGSSCLVSGLQLCESRREAEDVVLPRSLSSGAGAGTGRLVTKRMRESGRKGGTCADEYPGYARFVEEATIGHSAMQCSRFGTFPSHVQGRFVSCSPEHTLLRVGGGATSGPGGSGCAAWGVGARGQLGNGKREDEAEPNLMLGSIGWGVRIVQVAAGGGLVRVAHSLLLTSTGRVLSFGTAQYGALGHGYDQGKTLSDVLRPKYIEALRGVKVVCVSAGELHSGAVTEDGDVYTWGEGFCGQLGLGDRRPHLLPEQVTRGGLEDECVANISMGCRHTLVATDDGEVFSWGLGRFGVLGRSYTDFTYNNDIGMVNPDGDDGQAQGVAAQAPQMQPQEMDAVVQAAAEDGVPFDALISSLDALNLTLDDPSTQCIPGRVDALEGIRAVGVSAGHRHSMVLDEHGGLYTFGSGAGGALGHGDLFGQEFPVRVSAFEKDAVEIHQMSAGVDVSMAVDTRGNVYSWGKRADGRIGLGIIEENVKVPRKVDVGDPLFRAVDVECGYVHSVIVGLCGSVYQCGGVGTDGKEDGLQDLERAYGVDGGKIGAPVKMTGLNIWHRIVEPKEKVGPRQKWKKYGRYELKGRSAMMKEGTGSVA